MKTDLLCHSWAVFKVSPLFDFSCHSLHLYLSEFSALLLVNGVSIPEEVEFSFHLSDTLKLDLDEADTVEIFEKNENNLTVILYPSNLWKNQKSKYFSFLLIKGVLKQNFLQFLQCRFDCLVAPVVITEKQLLWLSIMCLESANSTAEKDFNLSFSLPNKISGCRSIHIDLKAKDFCKIWAKIEQIEHDVDKKVEMFSNALVKHVQLYFRIDLSLCALYEVATPVTLVSNDGVIKVFEADVVKPLFYYLRCLFADVYLLS